MWKGIPGTVGVLVAAGLCLAQPASSSGPAVQLGRPVIRSDPDPGERTQACARLGRPIALGTGSPAGETGSPGITPVSWTQPGPTAETEETPLAPVVRGQGPDPFVHPLDCGPCAWFGVDYLLWWIKSGPVAAPLVTTGTVPPPAILGPTEPTVLSPSSLNYGPVSGIRIDGGWWFDPGHLLGIDMSAFLLSQVSETRTFLSNPAGAPILGRPFIDTAGTPLTYLVSVPFVATGGVSFHSTSQLGGAEVNLLGGVLQDQLLSFTTLGGVRFLNLNESLQIKQFSQILNAVDFGSTMLLPGSAVSVVDSFRTSNQFYGGQIGGRLQSQLGLWTLGLDAKLAMGATVQNIRIAGGTGIQTAMGTAQSLPGGLLALPTNIGGYTSSAFSLVPEFGLNVGLRLGCVELQVGYTFLYWTNVVRPGAEIDPVINPNQLPASPTYGTPTGGINRPAVLFRNDDFWAQGFNFTVKISF